MQKFIAASITAAFMAFILWLFLVYGWSRPKAPTEPLQPIASVQYQCDGGKTITAQYFQGNSPDGKGYMQLSDLNGTVRLDQTISASGIRYSDGDPEKSDSEHVVFWSKGHSAFLEESGVRTYSGCIEISSDPGGLENVYENGDRGFSIRYPSDFRLDESYDNYMPDSSDFIQGIRFFVSSSSTSGTNLSPESYLSVELIQAQISTSSVCDAKRFLPHSIVSVPISSFGVEYTLATSTDVDKKLKTDESVYAVTGSNPCVAVRYVLRSKLPRSDYETLQPFDDDALRSQFDAIRKSLILQ